MAAQYMPIGIDFCTLLSSQGTSARGHDDSSSIAGQTAKPSGRDPERQIRWIDLHSIWNLGKNRFTWPKTPINKAFSSISRAREKDNPWRGEGSNRSRGLKSPKNAGFRPRALTSWTGGAGGT